DPDTAVQEFVAQFPHDAVTADHDTLPPISSSGEQDRGVSRAFVRLVGIGVPIAAAVVYFGIGMQRAVRSTGAPPPSATASPPAPTAEAPPPREAVPPADPSPAAPPPPEAAAPPAPATAVKSEPTAAPDALPIVVSARRRCYVSAT